MRSSIFFLAGYLSLTYAASIPANNPNPSLSTILEALRENNPEDAEAAASTMNIKLRRREPALTSSSDLSSILAALEENNPEDAAAARQNAKRQDDLSSILAALEENSPEDAAAAKQVGSTGGSAGRGSGSGVGLNGPDNVIVNGNAVNGKRGDDVSAILAALEENSPEDAAAARRGDGLTAVA